MLTVPKDTSAKHVPDRQHTCIHYSPNVPSRGEREREREREREGDHNNFNFKKRGGGASLAECKAKVFFP